MKKANALKTLIWACVLCSMPATIGQEGKAAFQPERCLPSSTLVYAEIPDFEATTARFKETAIYKIWMEPQVQAFALPIKDYISKQFDALKNKFTDEVGLPFDEIYAAFSGQVAGALISVNPPRTGPDGKEAPEGPDVVEAALFLTPKDPDRARALVEALHVPIVKGMEKAKIQDSRVRDVEVVEIFDEAKPTQPSLAHAWIGNTFVFVVGERGKTMQKILARWFGEEKDSLSANDDFRATRQRVGTMPTDFFIYAGVAEALKKFEDRIEPKVRDVFKASGLYSLRAASYRLSFDGPALRDIIYLRTAAEKEGFVSVLAPLPLDEKVLDLIPAEATSFLATRFNPALLWGAIDGVAKSLGEEDYSKFREAIGKANEFLGADIEKDIAPAFGDYAVFYGQPSPMGPMLFGLLDWVAVIQVKDKTKAETLGELIRQKTTEMAVKEAQKSQKGAEGAKPTVPFYWQSLPCGTSTIHYVTITDAPVPALAPGYAIAGDKLVVGLTLQNIQSALTRLSAPSSGVRSRADFAATFPKAPKGAGAILYSDVKANFPQTHAAISTILTAVSIGINAQAKGAQVNIDIGANPADIAPRPVIDMTKFPPPEVFSKHLFGSIMAVRGEESGISVESYSPGNSTIIPGVAIVAAIAIPSFLHARDAAQGATCKSNLKQIGLGIMMYANDADNRLPKDLQSLCPKYLQKEVLRCGLDRNPRGVKGGGEEGEIELSYTYIYIPEGLGAAGIEPAQTVLCFDSQPRHGGKRTVLFVDGHVEEMEEAAFQQRLAAQRWKPAPEDQGKPEKAAPAAP